MKIFVEEFNFYSNKITKPKKILILSDFHYNESTSKDFSTSIINSVRDIKPDYICLVGDYFCKAVTGFSGETPNIIKKVKLLIKELSSIATIIMSLGNHDYSKATFKNFSDKNVFPLDNESIEFDDICFSGFYPDVDTFFISNHNLFGKSRVKKYVSDWNNSNLSPNPNKLSILCHHDPFVIFNKYVQNNVSSIYSYDFIFSGHAHNGHLSLRTTYKLESKYNDKIKKLKKYKDVEKYNKLKNKYELKKYSGFTTLPYNFPPFRTLYARGSHYVNGANLVISKGLNSGLKLIYGNITLGNFYPYISEVNIFPVKQTKSEKLKEV